MVKCNTYPVLHLYFMTNLTLAVDHDLLHRARVRAAEEGTSVNAVVRELLSAYSAADRLSTPRSWSYFSPTMNRSARRLPGHWSVPSTVRRSWSPVRYWPSSPTW